MIPTFAWKTLAAIASRPAVARWLLRRAMRTPYRHIIKNGECYMERYWLFNPYDNETRQARWPWCPVSVRIHVIRKPDEDRHLHDHPWDARTFILRGWYLEERHGHTFQRMRHPGFTGPIGVGLYHRITEVSRDGAVTLFITGRERGEWGYLVDGRKVPWHQYLAKFAASESELTS